MSLDTVLKIGKAFRIADDNMKYFKYVEACPKNYPLCITIPIKIDYSFDWENVRITPENELDNLFYLKFKTSDNDNNPIKYLFGDINYGINKKGEDKGGWYKISRKINKKGIVTNHSTQNGGKPWKYAILAHDTISRTDSLEYLINQIAF